MFLMVQSADHVTALTGASPTVTLSKNGAAFGSPAGAVTEVSAGWYKVAGNATDTNTLGSLILHATAASGDPVDVYFDVVAFDPHVAYLTTKTGFELTTTERQQIAQMMHGYSGVYFVSPSGNDSNDGLAPATAKLTLAAAQTVAAAGSLIVVLSGTFNEKALGKNGVDWMLSGQSKIVYTGSGEHVVIGDSVSPSSGGSSAMEFNIFGRGTIRNDASSGAGTTIFAAHEDTRITIEASELGGSVSDVVWLAAASSNVPLIIRADRVESAGDAIYLSGGVLLLESQYIKSGSTAILSEGGEVSVHARVIRADNTFNPGSFPSKVAYAVDGRMVVNSDIATSLGANAVISEGGTLLINGGEWIGDASIDGGSSIFRSARVTGTITQNAGSAYIDNFTLLGGTSGTVGFIDASIVSRAKPTDIVSGGAITTSGGAVSTVTTLTNKTGFALSSTQTFNNTGTWTGGITGNVGGNVAGNVAGSVNSVTTGVTISGTITTLEALNTAFDLAHGAGSWATATGFSTHSAADVWAVTTRAITDKAGFAIAGTVTTLDALNTSLGTVHGVGSWATATGFSTHSAADVWAVGVRTITSVSGLTIDANIATWLGTAPLPLTSQRVQADANVTLDQTDLDYLLANGVAQQSTLTDVQASADQLVSLFNQGIPEVRPGQQYGSRRVMRGDTYGGDGGREIRISKSPNADWPTDLSDYEWAFTAEPLADNENDGTAPMFDVEVAVATGASRALILLAESDATEGFAIDRHSYSVIGTHTDSGAKWTAEKGVMFVDNRVDVLS